jgi:hypothetical protein
MGWLIFASMKRSIKFSIETERDLQHLAIVMHDGNVTATVSELIRTECRRRFGENYDIEATSEVVTTPQVVSVIKKQNKATRGVVSPIKKDTTPAVAEYSINVPKDLVPNPVVEEGVAFVVGPSQTHPQPSSEFLMDASAFKVVEEAVKAKEPPAGDKYAEARRIAAEKMAAKKAAPKTFTGITSQA